MRRSTSSRSVRAFAEASGARVAHLRTRNGHHEVGLIIERDDLKGLALVVMLSASISHVRATHLTWLGTSDNLSGLDKECGLCVIKPSGVAFDRLTVGSMSVVDVNDNPVEETNPSGRG